MNLKKILIIFALSLFILPPLVLGVSFESGDKLFLTNTIDDDYYVGGGSIQLEANVNGDLTMAGGDLYVNSVVEQDLTLVAGDITIFGEMGDDVRLAGGNITIHSYIEDDLFAAGGNILLSETSFVKGDMIFGAGNLVVDGEINGNMRGAGGNVYINNIVWGDVTLFNVDKVEIGPKGRVVGNFSYRSPHQAETINAETVEGTIEYKPVEKAVTEEEARRFVGGIIAGFSIFRLLTLLFIGLFFIWVVRYYATNSVKTAYEMPLKSFGFGFLALILLPIAGLISAITGIGWSLALVIFFSWILILIFGKLVAILMIGMKIIPTKEKSGFWRVYGAFALGALIYVVLGLIPVVGWVIQFILMVMGIGALTLYKIQLFNLLRKEKKV